MRIPVISILLLVFSPFVYSQAAAPAAAAPAPAGQAQAAPAPAPAKAGAAPQPGAQAGAAPAAGQQPPPAAPAAPGGAAPGGGAQGQAQTGQVPPVTTANVPITLPNGQVTNVQTVFTQTFGSVPSPYPSAKKGSVGMGTLTGKVGAVKATAKSSTNAAPPAASGKEVTGFASILTSILGSAFLGLFF